MERRKKKRFRSCRGWVRWRPEAESGVVCPSAAGPARSSARWGRFWPSTIPNGEGDPAPGNGTCSGRCRLLCGAGVCSLLLRAPAGRDTAAQSPCTCKQFSSCSQTRSWKKSSPCRFKYFISLVSWWDEKASIATLHFQTEGLFKKNALIPAFPARWSEGQERGVRGCWSSWEGGGGKAGSGWQHLRLLQQAGSFLLYWMVMQLKKKTTPKQQENPQTNKK